MSQKQKPILSRDQIKRKFGLRKQKDIEIEHGKQFDRKPGVWKIGMTEKEFLEVINR